MTKHKLLKYYFWHFKTLKDCKYVTNVDLHEQPNGYWVAIISFQPFKDEKIIELLLSFGCNEADMPNRQPSLRSLVGCDGQVSHLTDDFFQPYRNGKDISWIKFEELLLTIHDWVIEVIINSSTDFDVVVNLINKYIPDNYFDNEDEFMNKVRSRLGINKFNL